jgi:hypothetical protein
MTLPPTDYRPTGGGEDAADLLHEELAREELLALLVPAVCAIPAQFSLCNDI